MGEPAADRPAGASTLAERLEWLFDKIRPSPDELGPKDEAGRPYLNYEIADKINAGNPWDVTITPQYVGELRRGVRGATDPRVSHAKAVAWAFGVDPSYLIDDRVTEQVQRDIKLLLDLRSMGVHEVALRTVLVDSGLGEDSVELVQSLVRKLLDAGGNEPGRPVGEADPSRRGTRRTRDKR
ncbi:hypothetical protein [Micromonospora sp. CPCC 206061]|uniref:hypothetical protein n=1 Tax=Micromonospora sp. CPCC 206061 TaxID=3122410 RepID=UPI002FF28F10